VLLNTRIYGGVRDVVAKVGFRQLKQEIGSARTQTRNPAAVTNHLHPYMAATTITWINGARFEQTLARRHAVGRRTEYAFADLRRALAHALNDVGFGVDCAKSDRGARPLIGAVMGLVASGKWKSSEWRKQHSEPWRTRQDD
jgi:hypothetical protein